MSEKKKYDLAIMNPPYAGRLHLRILEKVIPACDEVINISPTGWLMDIPAVLGWKKTTFQMFEDGVAKHIKSLQYIDAKKANDMFSIGSFESVSVLHCDNGEYDIYKTLFLDDKRKNMDVFNKTIVRVHDGEVDNIEDNVKLSTIHGNPGMRDEFDVITPQKQIAKRFKPETMSEEEWDNFHNSCQTIFMKYCNLLTRQGQHLQTRLLPYMGDYSKPWTNKRFCDYFKITGYISDTEAEPGSEWEEILTTMEKYK